MKYEIPKPLASKVQICRKQVIESGARLSKGEIDKAQFLLDVRSAVLKLTNEAPNRNWEEYANGSMLTIQEREFPITKAKEDNFLDFLHGYVTLLGLEVDSAMNRL